MSNFVDNTQNMSADDFEQYEIDRIIEENNIDALDLQNMELLEKEERGEDIDGNDEVSSNPDTAPTNLAAVSEVVPVAAPKSTKGPSNVPLPKGAMPVTKSGALDEKAGEFWFPECKDCPCCKGYKHGCNCRKNNSSIFECHHPACKVVIAVAPVVVEEVKVRHKPVIVLKSKSAPAPLMSAPIIHINSGESNFSTPAMVANASSLGPPMETDTRELCRFFATPQGCRFGATCNFRHHGVCAQGGSMGNLGAPAMIGLPYASTLGFANAPALGRSYSSNVSDVGNHMKAEMLQRHSSAPSALGDGNNTCRFFQSGNCRKGPACPFKHDTSL